MKFFVTIPLPNRFTYPNAVEVEATSKADALVSATRATVWTEDEWAEAQRDMGIPE